MSTTSIIQLPTLVYCVLFGYLGAREAAVLSQACRLFTRCFPDAYWQRLFRQRYDITSAEEAALLHRHRQTCVSWRGVYGDYRRLEQRWCSVNRRSRQLSSPPPDPTSRRVMQRYVISNTNQRILSVSADIKMISRTVIQTLPVPSGFSPMVHGLEIAAFATTSTKRFCGNFVVIQYHGHKTTHCLVWPMHLPGAPGLVWRDTRCVGEWILYTDNLDSAMPSLMLFELPQTVDEKAWSAIVKAGEMPASSARYQIHGLAVRASEAIAVRYAVSGERQLVTASVDAAHQTVHLNVAHLALQGQRVIEATTITVPVAAQYTDPEIIATSSAASNSNTVTLRFTHCYNPLTGKREHGNTVMHIDLDTATVQWTERWIDIRALLAYPIVDRLVILQGHFIRSVALSTGLSTEMFKGASVHTTRLLRGVGPQLLVCRQHGSAGKISSTLSVIDVRTGQCLSEQQIDSSSGQLPPQIVASLTQLAIINTDEDSRQWWDMSEDTEMQPLMAKAGNVT